MHCCYAAINEKEAQYNGGKGIKIVDIDEKDRTQYDERGLDQRAYNFGVEILQNAQFNHQTRGSDGVTYGCYGYLDEYGDLVSKLYLADAHGYRLLNTTSDVIEVFPVASKSKYKRKKNFVVRIVKIWHFCYRSLNLKNRRQSRGKFTKIKDIHFPKGCGSLEFDLQISPLARSFSLPASDYSDIYDDDPLISSAQTINEEFVVAPSLFNNGKRRTGKKSDGFYYHDSRGR